MQQILSKINFLTGSADNLINLSSIPAKIPFDDEIINFLDELSRYLMHDSEAKLYPDIITFAFWIRKSSVNNMREKLNNKNFRLGRGTAFHIAPSNVPVNFAYSLVSGLLTGNANIVRIPSKNFDQVRIINRAVNIILENYDSLKNYIILVRYEHDNYINNFLSSISDIRVIWGGDETIKEIRKSPLNPRSIEITFADRYSITVIDSEYYLSLNEPDKNKISQNFYNDTFLTDQNACTSPNFIIWLGDQERINTAKKFFWPDFHEITRKKYNIMPIQAINKLTSAYICAAKIPDCEILHSSDNLIVRINLKSLSPEFINYRDNSGFFFEYDCNNIIQIKNLCNDKRCQTVSYIANQNIFTPLINSGVKGIDRIVPVGRTLDFALIWDGYDLISTMTRIINLE
ncbi:MAG: hypothetical protein IJS99_08960 [Synergistaceae bacterium]|nr:hypothetical protein [Synergistaceae bacterium]